MSHSGTPILDQLRARANQMKPKYTPDCKICRSETKLCFSLPSSKLTGHAIPDEPDDCNYFECTVCQFLFSQIHDDVDNTTIYNEHYWDNQDPDWGGRVQQTLRLVLMGNKLLNLNPWEIRVLDFGCGMGTFVEATRRDLQMQTWGTDIIKPKFGLDWYMPTPPNGEFDIIVSCEVLEHLPDPYEILKKAKDYLKPGGVLAFQTAQYDPAACDRTWWYLGPANGHISLYSRDAFDVLAERLGVTEKLMWNDYPGLQAWKF